MVSSNQWHGGKQSIAVRLVACLVASAAMTVPTFAQTGAQTESYADFNPGKGDKGREWVQRIEILSPELRSDVKGDVKVEFRAPGMVVAKAMCWQQPTNGKPSEWGQDVTLAELKLDAQGNGSFVFPADKFPNGPVHVRIYANNEDKTQKDYREIQLYNTGGVKWNQGLPKAPPPQASGMKLLFADDFDKPLSISSDGDEAVYQSHKPGGGDFSGWPFSDFESEVNPFHQVDTFLRIRGSKRADGKSSSGLISPVRSDWSGVYAAAPYFMECRLIAQSAPGTWPAFWTLTRGGQGSDELDIIEAYGGFGKGNPNYTGYSTTSHFWGQTNPDGSKKKAIGKPHDMFQIGGKSSWSHTFHNYGLLVTEKDTVYFLDGIETQRHPTNELSKTAAHFFLINYAIGGISGWPTDLKREGNATDMYVDWVCVYSAKPAPKVETTNQTEPTITTNGVGLNFAVAGSSMTELRTKDVAGEAKYAQREWNNLVGPRGNDVAVEDASGKRLDGMTVSWSVPEGADDRSKFAREWGFSGPNLRLQRGVISNSGTLTVKGVPYPKYSVVLYFNAGDNNGKGKVTLSSPGDAEPTTRFYHVGWTGGKFVQSDATTAGKAKDANFVVFENISQPTVDISWDGTVEGGETGLAGVQIISSK